MNPEILRVEALNVIYPSRHGDQQAVKNVSFELNAGEILGIVGESGAGKSTIGNAITGLLSPPAYFTGKALFKGQDLHGLDAEALRKIRGKSIGFIFQDPMTSLNPLFTIGDQLTEPMRLHLGLSASEAKKEALRLLEAVGIPDPATRLNQYPHQFSGGMRQRVVIAIALSTRPELIIADEPTTALDVSIQDQILQLIKKLCREQQVACILVTHDMGVVSSVTDRVMVMYRGEQVELGTTEEVLKNPQHEYSKNLIAAVPPAHRKLKRFPNVHEHISPLDVKTHWIGQGSARPSGNLLEVKNVSLKFCTHHSVFPSRRKFVQAVNDVSLTIKAGESFGLVGESGSGKSTMARIITGLYAPQSGEIFYAGKRLDNLNTQERLPYRRELQMVFQNPYSSINPRMKIKDIIAEPMRLHRLTQNEAETRQIVADLLAHVGLPQNAGEKYPHEFSGGQRQRISIARALATRPHFLICDEPTSALDVSVQAQILNLLKELQEELGLTLLFISHDLPVIRQMCDRIGVMRYGQLVEIADGEALFESPQHEYTQNLIQLMPQF